LLQSRAQLRIIDLRAILDRALLFPETCIDLLEHQRLAPAPSIECARCAVVGDVG
jgi:hypothetical protein